MKAFLNCLPRILAASISKSLSPKAITFVTAPEALQTRIKIDEKFERKRIILRRGCSIIKTLDEISKNGSDFKSLLEIHENVQNLTKYLQPDSRPCYPPLKKSNAGIMTYVLDTKSDKSDLFCLPLKCGTTSYQRALASELTKRFSSLPEQKRIKIEKMLRPRKGPLESDDMNAPKVYYMMSLFGGKRFMNPAHFERIESTNRSTPVYENIDEMARVINTRNPFDRIHAAWSDKFRVSKLNFVKWWHYVEFIKNFEDKRFPIPKNYTVSFEAFVKYLSIGDSDTYNRHWRSIFWSCHPCQLKYDFILDIATAEQDSKYIFDLLSFKTHLPMRHDSSSDHSNSLSHYYRNIPKSVLKAVYSKYFLDFVLFDFNTDQVEKIIESGNDEKYDVNSRLLQSKLSEFRKLLAEKRREKGSDVEEYENCNQPDYKRWWRLWD